MSHTPGPWVAEESRDLTEILGANDQPVCQFSLINENEKADARLIASAPELLAALEQLVLADQNYELCEEDFERAEDAIKKARGG
jgi:hypothetical protein